MTNLFDFEKEKEGTTTGIKEKSIVYQIKYNRPAGERDPSKEYCEED